MEVLLGKEIGTFFIVKTTTAKTSPPVDNMFFFFQDARVAAQELTVRNPWGHGITVEPAVRSEAERALGKKLHATLNRWT